MTLQLIKITSSPDLVDQVYRSLLDAISDGTFLPGARILQEDIAEQLAVSRQPVLQALRLPLAMETRTGAESLIRQHGEDVCHNLVQLLSNALDESGLSTLKISAASP